KSNSGGPIGVRATTYIPRYDGICCIFFLSLNVEWRFAILSELGITRQGLRSLAIHVRRALTWDIVTPKIRAENRSVSAGIKLKFPISVAQPRCYSARNEGTQLKLNTS